MASMYLSRMTPCHSAVVDVENCGRNMQSGVMLMCACKAAIGKKQAGWKFMGCISDIPDHTAHDVTSL